MPGNKHASQQMRAMEEAAAFAGNIFDTANKTRRNLPALAGDDRRHYLSVMAHEHMQYRVSPDILQWVAKVKTSAPQDCVYSAAALEKMKEINDEGKVVRVERSHVQRALEHGVGGEHLIPVSLAIAKREPDEHKRVAAAAAEFLKASERHELNLSSREDSVHYAALAINDIARDFPRASLNTLAERAASFAENFAAKNLYHALSTMQRMRAGIPEQQKRDWIDNAYVLVDDYSLPEKQLLHVANAFGAAHKPERSEQDIRSVIQAGARDELLPKVVGLLSTRDHYEQKNVKRLVELLQKHGDWPQPIAILNALERGSHPDTLSSMLSLPDANSIPPETLHEYCEVRKLRGAEAFSLTLVRKARRLVSGMTRYGVPAREIVNALAREPEAGLLTFRTGVSACLDSQKEKPRDAPRDFSKLASAVRYAHQFGASSKILEKGLRCSRKLSGLPEDIVKTVAVFEGSDAEVGTKTPYEVLAKVAGKVGGNRLPWAYTMYVNLRKSREHQPFAAFADTVVNYIRALPEEETRDLPEFTVATINVFSIYGHDRRSTPKETIRKMNEWLGMQRALRRKADELGVPQEDRVFFYIARLLLPLESLERLWKRRKYRGKDFFWAFGTLLNYGADIGEAGRQAIEKTNAHGENLLIAAANLDANVSNLETEVSRLLARNQRLGLRGEERGERLAGMLEKRNTLLTQTRTLIDWMNESRETFRGVKREVDSLFKLTEPKRAKA